jgi:hypothetical protein
MADRARHPIGRTSRLERTSMLDLALAGPSTQVSVGHGEAVRWAALAVLLAITLAPTFMVEIPAMVDYPNHLARMHLLAAAGTPDASPYYQVSWGVYPNLAMDLIVPPIGRLIGVEAATRAFLLVSQLLVVAGAIALEWAVKGHHRIAGFAAVLVLHGLPFAMGFVNFEFAMGMALFAIASWIGGTTRSWPARLAVHSAFVALLFAAHFFALGAYGLAIGCYELWRLASHKTEIRAATVTFGLMAAPALLALCLMALTGGAVGGSRILWLGHAKVWWLLLAVNGYNLDLSAACVISVVLMLYVFYRRGLLAWSPPAPWLAAAFALAFVLIPFRLLDTAFVDVRIVIAAALVLPAFVTITFPNMKAVGAMMAVVTAVTLASVSQVVQVWRDYQHEYAALKTSFTLIERGSRVLVGHSGEGADPPNLNEYPIYHAPTLAVHHAKALVPTLFTYPGKQPVEVVPAFRHLTVTQGNPPPIRLLQQVVEGQGEAAPAFVRTWTRDFDYLYLVGPRTANPIPEILEELAHASRFTLYRIRR